MNQTISKFQQRVMDCKQKVKCTDVHTVYERMQAGDNFYLVDTREESEWARGSLPHAAHLSKGVLEVKIENAIPDTDAKIILYCGGGSRSAIAAESLQQMGYTNVVSMDGGFRGWAASGYPLQDTAE